MIRQPTQHELEALAVLEHNPNFIALRQWLEDSLRATHERCAQERDEVTLRQAQGAAMDLTDFLEHARTARGTAEKLRKRTP
ncbi:hypothetical protein [Marinobacter sp.]|uniref:hypothetical protein n=1 Tax=Marinobacter sp. TaxID=50741 RepID=UPI003A8CB9D5